MCGHFFSQLNYARFYLPRLLPSVKGRIVYVDDDCIVQGMLPISVARDSNYLPEIEMEDMELG